MFIHIETNYETDMINFVIVIYVESSKPVHSAQ